jgi:hypothetical protein
LEDLNNYQKKAEKQEKSTSVCGLNDGRFEKNVPRRPQGKSIYWGGKRILEYGTRETFFK